MIAIVLFAALLIVGVAVAVSAVVLRLRRGRAGNFQTYNVVLTVGIFLIVGGAIGLQRALAR